MTNDLPKLIFPMTKLTLAVEFRKVSRVDIALLTILFPGRIVISQSNFHLRVVRPILKEVLFYGGGEGILSSTRADQAEVEDSHDSRKDAITSCSVGPPVKLIARCCKPVSRCLETVVEGGAIVRLEHTAKPHISNFGKKSGAIVLTSALNAGFSNGQG
jgi:hypothetical protein